MGKYRHALPQLQDGCRFVTDGGLETTLIFHQGIDLPAFAAFVLLEDDAGRARLRRYFEDYLAIARAAGLGFVLESATWRANPDWAASLGYSAAELAALNRRAIDMLEALREAYETPRQPIVISGCIGPRGDGYVAESIMTPAAAEAYHRPQIETFAASAADLVTAITMTNVPEAIGIARAAAAAGIPSAISFTVETDGRLPSGDSLREAIEAVDAASDRGPAYYMINCAHPEHFAAVLEDAPWVRRIRGLRANASVKSHAELNEATTLDIGDIPALGEAHRELSSRLPALSVLGGCCGTDHRHVEAMVRACAWQGV